MESSRKCARPGCDSRTKRRERTYCSQACKTLDHTKTIVCSTCQTTFEAHVKPSSAPRKFCSVSCATSYNNRAYPKRTLIRTDYGPACLLCGKSKRTNANKYCSSGCHVKASRKKRIEDWLSNGVARDGLPEGDSIREYIYLEQDNICALCPQNRTWNGKRLNFILDHIDGNAEDSSRDNMRLICPNCDFQLPTSKGGNRGSGRAGRRARYLKTTDPG